jgi:hypothetical protein
MPPTMQFRALSATHWTDLPFPEGLEITGHLDGLAVRYRGRVVSTHGPNLSAAARGLTEAREVLAAIGDLPVNDNPRRHA